MDDELPPPPESMLDALREAEAALPEGDPRRTQVTQLIAGLTEPAPTAQSVFAHFTGAGTLTASTTGELPVDIGLTAFATPVGVGQGETSWSGSGVGHAPPLPAEAASWIGRVRKYGTLGFGIVRAVELAYSLLRDEA